MAKKHRSFNILGNIAVVNFSKENNFRDKKKFAEEILSEHQNIKSVFEKSGNFKGRLRKMKVKFLAGERNKEVLYHENHCVFRFNIDKIYFSTRLSGERKEISELIRRGEKVFVMFAGAAPFSVVIAKNSKAKMVYSNELGREANKYGRINAELNHVKDKIIFLDGDIKRVAKKLSGQRINFDVIVMPRPNLKETFLKEAFALSKKSTRIFYYGFCEEKSITEISEEIKSEAKKYNKKIKIRKIKKAGEIAPHKFRVRIDFQVV